MGWVSSSQWRNKKEMVNYLTDESGFAKGVKIDNFSLVGNNLWLLLNVEGDEEKRVEPYKTITLYRLEYSKQDGGYGYKGMDETCGPYYYNCPITFIKAVSPYPAKSFANEWRKKVLAFHKNKAVEKRKKKSFSVGQVIKLYDEHVLELKEYLGRRGWLANCKKSGGLFRLKANQVKDFVLMET